MTPWQPGDCLALARHGCAFCLGLGLRQGRAGKTSPCNCVLRAVFRACYGRFRRATDEEQRYARTSWGDAMKGSRTGGRKKIWGFIEQEYACDFIGIAKRTLGEGSLGWKVFRFHYLLGADHSLCARKLGLDRGEFFHECYRVQQKLGRAYRETQPYALFPTDEYFGHVVCGVTRSLPPAESLSTSTSGSATERLGQPLRAPLKSAA